jgi:hypothetical protein
MYLEKESSSHVSDMIVYNHDNANASVLYYTVD